MGVWLKVLPFPAFLFCIRWRYFCLFRDTVFYCVFAKIMVKEVSSSGASGRDRGR